MIHQHLGLTRLLAHKPMFHTVRALTKIPKTKQVGIISQCLPNYRTFVSNTLPKLTPIKAPKQTTTQIPQSSTQLPQPSTQLPQPSTQSAKSPTSIPQSSVESPISTPQSSAVWTIPNILTFTRIFSTPFIGYYIVTGNTKVALLIFVYSCVTDFIDGYIARKFKLQSVLGSIIDPLADKFLMTTCILSLAYINSIPILVASLIVGRDVMLSFMSFYYRYQSLVPPRTVGKFLNLAGNPTISVHPNLLGKVNTALQMVYVGGVVFQPVVESIFATDLSVYSLGMAVLVSATTVLSGLTYISSKSSMKYIK